MQITHHDDRPYDLAVSEAARKTREKFDARIEAGRAEGAGILDKILATQPVDRIADTRALSFDAPDGNLMVRILDQHEERVHANALAQFADKEEVPIGYLRNLLATDGWGRDLALRTLNDLAKHRTRRALLRSVDGELRGFLSDSYRRLDSRPLVEAFAKACIRVGALPVGGHHTDLRVGLRAIFPEVVDPLGNDPLLFGLQWSNSDFGVGGHELKLFVERLWCTNLATRENVLRQVHLGRRLPDDISFSEKTYALDTAAVASAVSDLVEKNISREAVDAQARRIVAASETEIDEKRAKGLLDEKLNKTESKAALSQFAQNPYVEQLPQRPTLWRLSNAVSWIAKSADAERRVELQEVAGWLLGVAKAA
jgi:hypothetical protein